MKKILLALTILAGLLAPLAPSLHAQNEVSLNFFYDNLSSQGSWIEVGDYGYCFQPDVAANNPNWRPYADGYWAYTDEGWTWVSYEDFGWATYHYGRWANLANIGWVWVPGYEWGPAWVSWRTGGDYVGWAPLPPESREVVYEGRAITGQVDVQFDIGPQYYNFVDIRYIGEPVVARRIIEPQRNVTIINRTVNVTNITRNNTVVYNYGPDINRVNQFSERKIQHLKLQREATAAAAQGGGRRNFNRVEAGQLRVVAPTIQKSPQQLAPPKVKTQVKNVEINRGWNGVDRQKIQAEMKKENAQNVPPPTFKPQPNRPAAEANAAGAQPANSSNQAATTPADNNPPPQRAARRARQRGETRPNAQPGNTGNNATETAPAPATTPATDNTQKADQGRAAEEARGADQAKPNDNNADRAQQLERRKALRERRAGGTENTPAPDQSANSASDNNKPAEAAMPNDTSNRERSTRGEGQDQARRERRQNANDGGQSGSNASGSADSNRNRSGERASAPEANSQNARERVQEGRATRQEQQQNAKAARKAKKQQDASDEKKPDQP